MPGDGFRLAAILSGYDLFNSCVVWRDNLDEKFAAHGRAILAVAAA